MFNLSKIIDKLFKGDKTYNYNGSNDPYDMSIDEMIFEARYAVKEHREKEKLERKKRERDELVEMIADKVIEKLKEEGLCKSPGYTATSGPINLMKGKSD